MSQIIPIDAAHIRELYVNGLPHRPWLSLDAIVKHERRMGRRLSKPTLVRVLHRLRAAGELTAETDAKRAARKVKSKEPKVAPAIVPPLVIEVPVTW